MNAHVAHFMAHVLLLVKNGVVPLGAHKFLAVGPEETFRTIRAAYWEQFLWVMQQILNAYTGA